MNEMDPHELPIELFDELYLPKQGCWRHHHSMLRAKEKHYIEPLLKQAGIVIKHAGFGKEEDAIIRRNWDEMKDELRYKEGEDPRMYVGFGKKTYPEEVSDCVARAKDANFNQNICRDLPHRFLQAVRQRFERLFDPKKLSLQQNKTPYKLATTPRNNNVVKKDGKICRMNEKELNQLLTAINETDSPREAILRLQRELGIQWLTDSITNRIRHLKGLEKAPLQRDAWNTFYKCFMTNLKRVEKMKSDMELVALFEDEEYDWKGNAPWLTVAICKGINRTKKYLIRAWRLILEKIRSVIAMYRENGRMFVVYHIMEYVLHEDKFDEWRKESAENMEEEEARHLYEERLIAIEDHLIATQRRRNNGHASEFHEICRFDNGQLVEVEKSRLPRKSRDYTLKPIEMEENDIDYDEDDTEDDGPLQDPFLMQMERMMSDYKVGSAEHATVKEERAEPIEEREDEDVQLEKKKKKKRRSNENEQTDEVDSIEKKRERKHEKRRLSEEDKAAEDVPPEVSSPKRKKERTEEEEVVETEVDRMEKREQRGGGDDQPSQKKKKKERVKEEEVGEMELREEGEVNYQSSQEKKKKKKERVKKAAEIMDTDEREERGEDDDQSKKKKKKRVKEEDVAVTEVNGMEREEGGEGDDQSSKKKKKKDRVKVEEVGEMEEREEGEVNDKSSHKKKKKKRRSSNGITEDFR